MKNVPSCSYLTHSLPQHTSHVAQCFKFQASSRKQNSRRTHKRNLNCFRCSVIYCNHSSLPGALLEIIPTRKRRHNKLVDTSDSQETNKFSRRNSNISVSERAKGEQKLISCWIPATSKSFYYNFCILRTRRCWLARKWQSNKIIRLAFFTVRFSLALTIACIAR